MADNNPGMRREELVDIRGMAQARMLFENAGATGAPAFVAHEFVLTDGAGHDYGPHHSGLREALYRTDRRIGAVLDLFRARGLIESTLLIVTSDHGMAAQRIELKANPACAPERAGMKGVFAEPMIYLRDMAIELARTRDLRALRVTVLDNDHLPDGEHPPLKGARVTVRDQGDATIGGADTDASGVAAFATPANLADADIAIDVTHPDFNSRQLRGTGESIGLDLRAILYGRGS
jgi:hypothetical protein